MVDEAPARKSRPARKSALPDGIEALRMRWAWAECMEGPRDIVNLFTGGKDRARFRIATGGRASGKSYTVCMVVMALGASAKHRILSVREYATSLDKSAFPLYETLAHEYEALGWKVKGRGLENERTGSTIQFHGASTSTGTARSIKSTEGVTILHVEEGQDMTEEAWRVIVPTIRAPGAMFFVSLNPTRRTDPLFRLAHSQRDDVLHVHRNYVDNALLDGAVVREAEAMKAEDPELYRHIWLGEPLDDIDGETRVLSYEAVSACAQEWKDEYAHGEIHAGYDPAAEGVDMNALVIRQGPVVKLALQWSGRQSTLGKSVEKVVHHCMAHGVSHLYFDATGLGAGVRSDLVRLNPPFRYHGVLFGPGCASPDRIYQGRKRNRDAFADRAAQMGWVLKDRASKTVRLKGGENIAIAKAMFFGPQVSKNRKLLDDLLIPQYDLTTGRIRVRKKGKGSKSPDAYDALALSFAAKSEHGLRTPGPTGLQGWMDGVRKALA